MAKTSFHFCQLHWKYHSMNNRTCTVCGRHQTYLLGFFDVDCDVYRNSVKEDIERLKELTNKRKACKYHPQKDTPATDKQTGITTSNTRIGGESSDSPKSPDSDFANSQDVKP